MRHYRWVAVLAAGFLVGVFTGAALSGTSEKATRSRADRLAKTHETRIRQLQETNQRAIADLKRSQAELTRLQPRSAEVKAARRERTTVWNKLFGRSKKASRSAQFSESRRFEEERERLKAELARSEESRRSLAKEAEAAIGRAAESDRLRKELAAANEQLQTLQIDLEQHERLLALMQVQQKQFEQQALAMQQQQAFTE